MPLLRAINSAITRASTLSFIVTPHWLEMVCSKRTSFIDLKILSLCTDIAYSCSRLNREVGQIHRARKPSGLECRRKADANLSGNHFCPLDRTFQAVIELRRLHMWNRPDRLQLPGRSSGKRTVLVQPLAEQFPIGLAVPGIVGQHVKQLHC